MSLPDLKLPELLEKLEHYSLCEICLNKLIKYLTPTKESMKVVFCEYTISLLNGSGSIPISLCKKCTNKVYRCSQCHAQYLTGELFKNYRKSLVVSMLFCPACCKKPYFEGRIYFLQPTVRLTSSESQLLIGSIH